MDQDCITLARLTHARGIRGEIRGAGVGVGAARFAQLKTVTLIGPDGHARTLNLQRVWEHKGDLVFKFESIDDRNSAESLIGGQVCVSLAERAEPAEGEFYHSDLAGCRVEDEQGKLIGTVGAVVPTGGVDLLELTNGVLVPFHRNICLKIDVPNRRIVAVIPEGLVELNR